MRPNCVGGDPPCQALLLADISYETILYLGISEHKIRSDLVFVNSWRLRYPRHASVNGGLVRLRLGP